MTPIQQKFKKLLIETLLLKEEYDVALLDEVLTEEVITDIFKNNYENDFNYAYEKLSKSGNIDEYIRRKLEISDKINEIHNLNKVSNDMYKKIMSKDDKKILILVDNDTDGSTGAAGWLLLKSQLPKRYANKIIIRYTEKVKGTEVGHGINKEQVKEIIEEEITLTSEEKKKRVLKKSKISAIMTIDNGINNALELKELSEKILPKADFYVTDHHTPNETVVQESDNVKIVCSKYNPNTPDNLHETTDYFHKANISGAQMGIEVAKRVAKKMSEQASRIVANTGLINKKNLNVLNTLFDKLSEFSTQNDYVADADCSMMPQTSDEIKLYGELGNLLNTNNNIGFLVGDVDLKAKLKKTFDLDNSMVTEIYANISTLNYKASRLMEIYDKYAKKEETEENLIKLKEEIIQINYVEKKEYDLDRNYLSLLRPILIKETILDTTEQAGTYYSVLKEEMLKTFKNYQKTQKVLVEDLRKSADEGKNKIADSKIKVGNIELVILKEGVSRKLAALTENELATGMTMRVDKNNVGSFRSKYSHKLIFTQELKDFIKKDMGIEVLIAGHTVAAGISFKKENKDKVTNEELERIVTLADKQFQKIEEEEKTKTIYSINHFKLLSDINKEISGGLPGRTSIPFNVVFNEEQIKQMVNKGTQKYGWKVYSMSLDGNSFIIPSNVLNRILESGDIDNQVIEFQPMGNSFIASKLTTKTEKDLVKQKIAFIGEQEEFHEYYANMKSIGKNDAARVEKSTLAIHPTTYAIDAEQQEKESMSVYIELMNNTNIGSICVLDVETSNGLGKFALLSNLGMSVITKEGTGREIEAKEFEEQKFTTVDGKIVIVPKKNELISITEEERKEMSQEDKLWVMKDKNDNLYFNKDNNKYDIVYNYTTNAKGKIVYNEDVEVDNVASFIFEEDMKGKENFAISILTHIDESWLKKYGKTAEEVDEAISSYLAETTKGEPFLIQAHNIMFDFPILSQLPQTFDIFLKQGVFYDSAGAVKEARNANTSYCSISIKEASNGKNRTLVFDDQAYAMGTFNDFVSNIASGKESFILNVQKDYKLEFKDGDLVLRQNNRKPTILIEGVSELQEEDIYEILNVKKNINKSEKYGVASIDYEQLAYDIVNDVLLKGKVNRELIYTNGLKEDSILELSTFKRMLEKYKFTNEPKSNIKNYIHALGTDEMTGEEVLKKQLSELIKEEIKNGKIEEPKKVIEYIETRYEEYLEFLEGQIVDVFLLNNNDVYRNYTMIKIMTLLLPKLPDINKITKNQINILSNIHGIDTSTIKEVISIIRQFEEKYDMSVLELEELHFNLVANNVETAGDTTLETLLLLIYMNRMMVNPLDKQASVKNMSAIMEKYIILTHKKIFKYLHSIVNVNTYSAKQALDFNRSVISSKAQLTQDMKGKFLDEAVVKFAGDYMRLGTVVQADLSGCEDTEQEEAIDKINFISFVKNVENTDNGVYKMFDTKTLFMLNKMIPDWEVSKEVKEVYTMDSDDVSYSLANKDNKKKVEEDTATMIVNIEENPELWNERFKNIDFAAIKASVEVSKDIRETEKPFTTPAQIDKIGKSLTTTFYPKMVERRVSEQFLKETSELVTVMSKDMKEKYNVKIDDYKERSKEAILNKIFEIVADMHYSKRMNEYFSIEQFNFVSKEVVGYMSEEEKSKFKQSLMEELTNLLSNLKSDIKIDDVENILDTILDTTFSSTKEMEYIQEEKEKGDWTDLIKKTLRSPMSTLSDGKMILANSKYREEYLNSSTSKQDAHKTEEMK